VSSSTQLDVAIRPERADDHTAVEVVHLSAFDGPGEAKLVALLRAGGKDRIAQVACIEGDVVGHVVASPISLSPDPGLSCLGIGPIGVLPKWQGHGIGSLLMNSVIRQSSGDGVDALFLLGHPAYYQRFGFSTTHIANEYGVTDPFMALELRRDCLRDVEALAQYVPEFGEVGA